MLFVMVKACLHLDIFLFYRTFESYVLLINTNEHNEKYTSISYTSISEMQADWSEVKMKYRQATYNTVIILPSSSHAKNKFQ